MLAGAIGGDGAILYPFFAGAKTWTVVADTCHDIAAIEDFLVNGRDVSTRFHLSPPKSAADEVDVLEDVMLRAREVDGNYLVALFNLRSQETARVRLQAYLADDLSYEVSTVDFSDDGTEAGAPLRCNGLMLRNGLVLDVPSDYGVSLLLVRPVR
jgi:hypothetical protein